MAGQIVTIFGFRLLANVVQVVVQGQPSVIEALDRQRLDHGLAQEHVYDLDLGSHGDGYQVPAVLGAHIVVAATELEGAVAGDVPAIDAPGVGPETKKADLEKGEDMKDRWA